MIEQQQTQWTTFTNLNLWFDTWEESLVELRFARLKDKVRNVMDLLFFEG